jgi:hypothetical protein
LDGVYNRGNHQPFAVGSYVRVKSFKQIAQVEKVDDITGLITVVFHPKDVKGREKTDRFGRNLRGWYTSDQLEPYNAGAGGKRRKTKKTKKTRKTRKTRKMGSKRKSRKY